MPNFKYRAYDGDGKELTGKVFAGTAAEAVADLRARGVFVRDIALDERRRLSLEKGLSLPDVFLNLSSMIASGVMVTDAVRSLSLETEGRMREAMDEIHSNVVKGLSLSAAMDLHRDLFPGYVVSMVRAGEESGRLETVMTSIAGFLDRERELRDRVRSAMIYPSFMVGVSALLIFFVFVFVFPKITNVFIEQKIPLPFITRFFLAVSGGLFRFWYIILIAGGAAGWWLRRYYIRNRAAVGRVLFFSPVKMLRNLYIARFCGVLGLLLGGGVSVLRALEYARDVTGNEYLAGEIDRIRNEVGEGRRLSESARFFPPTYLQLVVTGEKTGNLVGSLGKIAEMAEREFRKSVENFLRILEPAIILVMGVVVGFMVISILLPIFQMNQIIK